jgi:hypothetical protein
VAEAKHTPGPLVVSVEPHAFHSHAHFAAVIHDSKGQLVAAVAEGPVVFDATGDTDEDAMRARDAAYAHLFGSAPDLLAACRLMAATLQGFTGDELIRRSARSTGPRSTRPRKRSGLPSGRR